MGSRMLVWMALMTTLLLFVLQKAMPTLLFVFFLTLALNITLTNFLMRSMALFATISGYSTTALRFILMDSLRRLVARPPISVRIMRSLLISTIRSAQLMPRLIFVVIRQLFDARVFAIESTWAACPAVRLFLAIRMIFEGRRMVSTRTVPMAEAIEGPLALHTTLFMSSVALMFAGGTIFVPSPAVVVLSTNS